MVYIKFLRHHLTSYRGFEFLALPLRSPFILLVSFDCIAKKGKHFLDLLKWTLKNTVA